MSDQNTNTTPDDSSNLDAVFQGRIDEAVKTAQAWEDVSLLTKIRNSIPFAQLNLDDGPYSRPCDLLLKSNDTSNSLVFLQRLARYFKQDVMTWVNQPTCESCGGTEMEYAQTRGPQTVLEKEGRASRVEEYVCRDCNQRTPFGRYNNPHTLFEMKQGRCGEYANLFGAYCRSVGLETRYVTDFTDHVWTECYINGNKGWIMVDSCEGVVDEPSMYEAGWQKKLNYVLAASSNGIVDVTARYTRQFYTADLQARRRAITSSEGAGEERLRLTNQKLAQSRNNNNNNSKQKSHSQRLAKSREETYLSQCRNSTEWNQAYEKGRISGSYAWKAARQEQGGGGDSKVSSKSTTNQQPTQLAVEHYYCPPRCPPAPASDGKDDDESSSSLLLSIHVFAKPTSSRHAGIVVNGTPCAVGNSTSLDDANNHSVSVVVVDDDETGSLGCILQSRSFENVVALANFVDTLPTGRIVALQGRFPLSESDKKEDKEASATARAIQKLEEELLVGLTCAAFADGILFVGQVRIQKSIKPEWVLCESFAEAPHGIQVTASIPTSSKKKPTDRSSSKLQLKTYRHTRPSTIVGRLDETVMPLATQLTASHSQKREAFLSSSSSSSSSWRSDDYEYAGYTTQPGTPIYLLGPTSYPLERVPDDEEWATFLWLPEPLVSKDDAGIVDDDGGSKDAPQNHKKSIPSLLFDIPLETSFFTTHLGHELLVRVGNAVDTVAALANARLIGLYFSAHWCGPCRSFTPMLAEMYQHLKETFPTHGLEIVFVTSDRDVASFNSYFATMPWMALPMESPSYSNYKQLLSHKYGVRGIPSLVILDAMSGQVVVGANASRGEVLNACNRGDEGIEELFQSWLDRLPSDTKEMVAMLEASCCEEDIHPGDEKKHFDEEEEEPAYLYRSTNKSNTSSDTSSKQETAARVRAKFITLVQYGMSPNEAAAKAIAIVSGQASNFIEVQLSSRVLNETDNDTNNNRNDPSRCLQRMLSRTNGLAEAQATLSTLLKYLENARKEPWTPKFRQFKLSNKIADRMIRGLELLHGVGVEVVATESDYCGSFPIGLDLEQLAEQLQALLEQAKQGTTSNSATS